MAHRSRQIPVLIFTGKFGTVAGGSRMRRAVIRPFQVMVGTVIGGSAASRCS